MRLSKLLALGMLTILFAGCDKVLTPEDVDEMKSTPLKEAAAQIGINIVLNTPATEEIRGTLGRFGPILDAIPEINAVRVRGSEADLAKIRALPFVKAANADAVRNIPPKFTLLVEDFANGLSTWNLDAIDVTDIGFDNRMVTPTGAGVFVGILDTGLMQNWPYYFPRERIAEEYARSFGGGGALPAVVSEQPNKWAHDTDGHGTHVTSTIIGYSLSGTPISGVAPEATVIPVKVLNQTGTGFTSVIAHGIVYIANLKKEPLADYPVVINMSLGGPVLDAIEKEAIDYAITKGVIICASAGNNGAAGMSYPGAYPPVISTAAAGWTGEWTTGAWWYAKNVLEPTDSDDFYIVDYSSRALSGQDLDLAAPGSWIVGPYQVQQGRLSYYYLGGTSTSSSHTAGTVALMAEVNPSLTAAQAEAKLQSSAVPMAPGCRTIKSPYGTTVEVCWNSDATGAGLLNAAAALVP